MLNILSDLRLNKLYLWHHRLKQWLRLFLD